MQHSTPIVPTPVEVHHDTHNEVTHVIKMNPDWIDITPTRRHGDELNRARGMADHSTLVQCLIVEHDPTTLADWASLEYVHLDELPEAHRRHEVYSVCIAKDVEQIVWVKDPEQPHVTTKVLYFSDYSLWTEPQVNAVILLMHAQLRPGGLKAGLRDDDGIKNAEKFADHYCRTVGVQRADLPTLHSSGSPHRISRLETHTINTKEPCRTYHGQGMKTAIPTAGVIYRQDSQTPLKLNPIITLGTEHGGVGSTVVVTAKGDHRALHSRLNSEDIHLEPEELRKIEKKKAKAAKKAAKAEKKKAKEVKKDEKKTNTKPTTPTHKYVQPTIVHKEAVKVVEAHPATHPVIPVVPHKEVHHVLPVSSTFVHTTDDYWTSSTMKASPMQA